MAAGQGHTANALAVGNFEAHGTVPASYTNQVGLYDRLLALAPHVTWANLDQVFKSSAFGVPRGAARTVQSPKPGVTIIWDGRYDIPHVYGRTRADVMFGAGYASAAAACS